MEPRKNEASGKTTRSSPSMRTSPPSAIRASSRSSPGAHSAPSRARTDDVFRLPGPGSPDTLRPGGPAMPPGGSDIPQAGCGATRRCTDRDSGASGISRLTDDRPLTENVVGRVKLSTEQSAKARCTDADREAKPTLAVGHGRGGRTDGRTRCFRPGPGPSGKGPPSGRGGGRQAAG